MKFKLAGVLILLISLEVFSQPKTSQISSLPGAFSRMGFGARGIAMGNAMTSNIDGSVNVIYNPALNPLINDNLIQLGVTFLSLDRKLNFVQISKSFTQYKRDNQGNKTTEVHSRAGVSFGIINAGVDNIDGRDNSGLKTKTYSTSENLFFLSVGISPSDKISFGITARYYYYSLFEKISSKAVGFDFGVIYRVMDNLTLGGYVGDINSKYRWDSTPIYGEDGNNFYDYFPVIKRVGVSYRLPKNFGIFNLDYEWTGYNTKIIKAGTEIFLYQQQLKLRAGIDRFNLANSDMIPKLSFGFGVNQILFNKDFEFNYGFVTEPYAPRDIHVISLGIKL